MLTIRQARTSDCEAVCGIHRAAIVHHYSRVHGDEANKWAELLRPDSYKNSAESGSMILAEEAGHALGFADFNDDTGEINMSILPEAEKRYVASALLAVVETEARKRGLDTLRVDAMVNTERMYIACGFEVSGAVEVPLSGAVTLPCIALQKQLVYTEPRPERRRSGNGKPVEVDRNAAPDA
jgi:putative acetyltransferase